MNLYCLNNYITVFWGRLFLCSYFLSRCGNTGSFCLKHPSIVFQYFFSQIFFIHFSITVEQCWAVSEVHGHGLHCTVNLHWSAWAVSCASWCRRLCGCAGPVRGGGVSSGQLTLRPPHLLNSGRSAGTHSPAGPTCTSHRPGQSQDEKNVGFNKSNKKSLGQFQKSVNWTFSVWFQARFEREQNCQLSKGAASNSALNVLYCHICSHIPGTNT